MSLRDSAKQIVLRLRDAGHQAYFVGGCVRDMVLGVEPHDVDIATDARPEHVRELFDPVLEVGAQFGVMMVRVDDEWFEVATFRSEGEYTDGRRPDEVAFTDARGDVQRRDLTINALLYDPVEDKIIDYVGGQDDIKSGIVRCVGDPAKRFGEDKLRLLRAVRFAARLEYEIEPETFRAIRDHAESVTVVSAERIGVELLNIFTGQHPDRGLQLLYDTGLLERALPAVHAMAGMPQPEQFHPEGDVFEHTKLMLSMMHQPSPELAMAALLHDVGKPPTYTVTDRIRFNEHARVGSEMAAQICRRLRLPNAVTDTVVDLVDTHMTFMNVQNMRESTLKRFMRQPWFEDALELHRIDCSASHGGLGNYEFCKAKFEALQPEQIRPPRFISGHNLMEMGYQPGPKFREILTAVEDAQLEGVVTDEAGAIEFVKKLFPLC
jgi:poly(A) polymerase